MRLSACASFNTFFLQLYLNARYISYLLGFYQMAYIKSLIGRAYYQFIISLLIKCGAAAQYPQVIAVGMAHYGIAIIFSQINYPVFTFKRPKKLHFKFGVGMIGNKGSAFSYF